MSSKLKDVVKRVFCIIVAITYATNYTQVSVTANDTSKKTYEFYDNSNICIYADSTNIQAGEKSIYSKIEKLTSDNDILDGIIINMGSESVFEADYNVSGNMYDDVTNIYSDGSVGIYTSQVDNVNTILAEESINVSVSGVNWKNGVLASKNGDISINAGNVDFSGIIYAPNGKVSITGTDIIIDGMIIAKDVEIYAGTVAVTNSTMAVYNNLKYSKLSNSTVFNMYYSEECEKIGIEYKYDYKSVDLYYRYDEGDFICEKDFDINSYLELPYENGYLEGYIIVTDKFGEKCISNIVSFHNDGYYYESTRDTDGDGISDAYELRDLNTNPNEKDSDYDGIIDCYDIYDSDEKFYDTEIRMDKSTYEYITTNFGAMYVIDEEKTIDDEIVCYLRTSSFDNEVRYFSEQNEKAITVYDSVTGEIKLKADEKGYVQYVCDNQEVKCAVLANDGSNNIVNVYEYNESGNLIKITHNGFAYDIMYNDKGMEQVNIAGAKYINYQYDENNNVSSLVYGNGYRNNYQYDELGNILSIADDNGVLYKWEYGEYYMLDRYVDNVNGYVVDYMYDSNGELSEVLYSNGEYIKYTYDGATTEKKVGVNNKEFVSEHFIGETSSMSQYDNGLTKATHFGDEDVSKESYLYNGASILGIKEFYEENTYVKSVGEDTYKYEFDENGNIVSEYFNGNLINSYEYDYLGQVIRANIKDINQTLMYKYDAGGNIVCVKVCELSYENAPKVLQEISYSYDSNWKDLMTKYNGESIEYDEIGNPIKYTYGREFSWSEGRNLSSITASGNQYEYSYNGDGLRVSKNINGEIVEYLYEETKLIYEKNNAYEILFLYDENGVLVGFEYEGNVYIYNKNIQNDIIGIFNTNGEEVVKYTYDLWGKQISISGDEELAKINPFRFKSYYFDEESGLYYLNSRYYDPDTGRFINADKHIDTNAGIYSNNMFAYCNNSPLVQANYSGEAPVAILVGIVAGIAILASGCSSNEYEPQYNELYLWDAASMSKYNCYGYAINKKTLGKIEPGYFITDDKANKTNGEYNLSNMQANAIADLKKIGYTKVKAILRSDIPTAAGTVICLRVGDDDFHWMKYIKSGDYWLHKPGLTAILKLKGEPQEYKTWYSEYYYDGYWYTSDLTYTSQILYISYK